MAKAEEAGTTVAGMTGMSGITRMSGASRIHPAIWAVPCLLALALRLAYLAAFRDSPFFSQLIVDAQWHDEWAWRWAQGLPEADSRAFFRAPLYPLWLSVLYRIFGHDLVAVRLVQAVLGAASAGSLALAGARWFGPRAGLAAGCLAAIYGPFIHYDGELLIPNLLIALLCGALAALALGPGPRSAGAAGLLLGLAGIARPNALVLLPAAALFAARPFTARPPAERPPAERPPAARPSAAHSLAGLRLPHVLLILGLGLAPALTVTAVNAAREGGLTGVASQAGLNFYAGHHAGATGKSMEIPEFRDLMSWRELVPASETIAEAAEHRDLDSAEVSTWWFRRGLAWIREHPGGALALTLRKLVYLLGSYEIPTDRDLYHHAPGFLRVFLWTFPGPGAPDRPPMPWGLGFPWGILMPLAGAALAAYWRAAPTAPVTAPVTATVTATVTASVTTATVRFLAAWIGLYAASILPFFVTGRFRLGMVPPMLLLAGLALARPQAILRRGPLILASLLFLVSGVGLFGARDRNLAAEEARLGDVCLRAGRTEEGLTALERSYAQDSTRTVTAYLLARGYAGAGRPREALRYYERVYRARPEDPEVLFEAGVLFLQIADYRRAAWVLEQFVVLRPEAAAGWVNLGVAYEESGDTERALAAYRRGTAIAPNEETALVRHAGLLLELERAPEAAALLAQAVARLPRSFDLVFSLAVARAAAGDSLGAREAAEASLRLRPEDARARALRETLAGPR